MNIPKQQRFYRLNNNSNANKWAGGVCLGLADSFKLEAWVIRLVWLLSVLYFGVGLLAYIFAWICLPLKNQSSEAPKKMILGVCAQIAVNNGLEVGIVRFIALTLAMASFGMIAMAYIIASFVMPKDSQVMNVR